MKRRVKPPLEKLQDKAEKLWKEYCKKRDGKCRLCGGNEVLQVHHIFSRTKKRLFLDIDNGITLCSRCHSGVTWDDSYKEKVRRLINKDTYERLFEQSCITGSFLEWKKFDWLEGQIKILEELLAEINKEPILTHKEG